MTALFVVCGLIAVAGAVGVVALRQPVHQVLALVLNFFALAVLYLSLNAEFMAVIQMIIYAGAIMVLFLFVIALLTARRDPGEPRRGFLTGPWDVAGAAVALILLVLLLVAVGRVPAAGIAASLPTGFGTVAAFGQALLYTHVFPFELTAFVLMVAVVGVIILVGRKQA